MNLNVNLTRQKHSFEVLLNSSNLTKMPSSAVGDVVPSKLQLAPLVLLDLNHRTRSRTRSRRKPGRRPYQLLRLGHHPNPAAGDYSHYQPLDDVDVYPPQANDPPPKYTPPPSYSTATGARIARMLRQSFRRSVRCVSFQGIKPITQAELTFN